MKLEHSHTPYTKVVVFNRVLELTDSSLTLDSISDF